MRHTFQVQVVAGFISLAAVLSADNRLFAAELTTPATVSSSTIKPPLVVHAPYGAIPSPSKPQGPSPAANETQLQLSNYDFNFTGPTSSAPNPKACPMDPTLAKLKDLGTHLGRAFDIAFDLLSGNQTDLLSKNKAALLSGNRAKILSDNAPKLLSENSTPILSGNTFSVLSNIKIEIHIDNSGNNNNTAGGAAARPAPGRAITMPEPSPAPIRPPRQR